MDPKYNSFHQIKTIIDNKALSKASKEAQIQAVNKNALSRRKEILTAEQQAALLGKWRFVVDAAAERQCDEQHQHHPEHDYPP
jgi:hypothetical protein